MYSTTISIPNIDAAKNFVDVMGKYNGFFMQIKSENLTIDPHSIMGVLSLDLTKKLTLETDENYPQEFISDISLFVVEPED
ncbi:MAG TPA: HPr family phosphocarrier protein [Clostridiales bacterium]|nr:HPr family phosphocarrier protein [Clostridiales bacterium]